MSDPNQYLWDEGARLMALQRAESEQAAPRYVQATDPVILSALAYDDVRAVIDQDSSADEVREISDSTARTVAGWFATSGRMGRELASLSTGCRVELGALLYDVTTARGEHPDLSPIDHRALDCLATWALRTATDSDGVSGETPPPATYVLQCGACDGEVGVTREQFADASIHTVPHEGCAYDGGGVDLDHARRHGDWRPVAVPIGLGVRGVVGGTVTFPAERLDDGCVIFQPGEDWVTAPASLAETFRPQP